MATNTSIEWTQRTWNPVRGCALVSPGCTNCYAMRQAHRFSGSGKPYEGLTRARDRGGPVWTGEARLVPEALGEPLRWRDPLMIFVNSMSDLFHEKLSNEEIAAVFGVMAAAPKHRFQVLTKRARRMREWFAWAEQNQATIDTFRILAIEGRIAEYFSDERVAQIADWPGYFITSRGRVVSDRKGPRHDLKHMLSGESGHCRVMLYRGEGREEAERLLVHRLVLEAFDRAPVGTEQGRHLDGDPENNALWNLKWGTQSQNWNDRRRHGNGRSYHKLTDEQVSAIREGHANGLSMAGLAAKFGVSATQVKNIVSKRQWVSSAPSPWPLPWVWLGVSVEDQQRADERIPHLLDAPATVRFLSVEPMLGPVDLTRISAFRSPPWPPSLPGEPTTYLDVLRGDGVRPSPFGVSIETHVDARIDWVICGGESGPGARPFCIDWARRIVNDCKDAGVPVFVKQLGAKPFAIDGLAQTFSTFQQWVDKAQSWLRDGTWVCTDMRHRVCATGADMMRARDEDAFPVTASPLLKLKDRKGGTIEEWPRGDWPREFPEVRP